MVSDLNWRAIALRGGLGGAIGGLLFGAVSFPAAFHPMAAGAQLAEYAALYGVACLAWGVGYAYLAATQSQINRFPVLSGLTFGVVVYVVTQLVLYGVAREQIHTAQQVAVGLSATCAFFGLPVAVISLLFERSR